MTDVFVRPTQYVVSVFPDRLRENRAAASDASAWDIRIEERSAGKWAVVHASYCLGAHDGEWDHEPSPSNRTDEWIADHRFTLEEATRLAIDEAPFIMVNGLYATQVRDRHAARLPVEEQQ